MFTYDSNTLVLLVSKTKKLMYLLSGIFISVTLSHSLKPSLEFSCTAIAFNDAKMHLLLDKISSAGDKRTFAQIAINPCERASY